MRSNVKSEQ